MAMAENHMSPRERQIAGLLLLGYDNGEIAQELKMKRRTVKAHMSRLFRRFDIKDGIKRVKLATLLYRRQCADRNSGANGFPANQKSESLNSSSTADSSLSTSASQTPPMQLPENRDAGPALNP